MLMMLMKIVMLMLIVVMMMMLMMVMIFVSGNGFIQGVIDINTVVGIDTKEKWSDHAMEACSSSVINIAR